MTKISQKINQLQKDFFNHLYHTDDHKILSYLAYDKAESLKRLDIYRHNVLGNYHEVLESIYPVTKKILNKQNFSELGQEYCQKFKSKCGNLDEYGAKFPDFLSNYQSKFDKDYLSDLARLELYYHLCYFSANVENFDLEAFQKLSEIQYENLTFELHPSCFFLKSDHDILTIWQQQKPKINYQNQLLIMRPFAKEQVIELAADEFLLLDEIKQKQKLYNIYQKIVNKNKKDFDIGASINKFISLGAIINFKT